MTAISQMVDDSDVRRVIRAAIEAGLENGVHVAAYLGGRLVLEVWDGLADPETGRAVGPDTLFNVYSVSKAVAATALHIHAERGLVDYDSLIGAYWPEFAVNGKERATVRHALTHRVGLPQMPSDMTPARMCDWDALAADIAALPALAPPGEKTLYESMTFGWIVGEIVRRTDPSRRDFQQFLLDEICTPLGLEDLWFGIPDAAESRVAKMSNRNAGDPPPPLTTLFMQSMPPAVALIPEVFELPNVRRACIPAVGGIFNARDEARFWAMLAQGGELDGVRLLSQERVASFQTLRTRSDEPDPVMFGIPLPISNGGYWLGGPRVFGDRAIWHPGAGGSIGWADPERELAVAICHNRMFTARKIEDDPIYPISAAIIKALGLENKKWPAHT